MEASHFQNFHLFMAMAAASRDVNKWKRTQEMSTLSQRMNQNLMNLSLKPASDFNWRVTSWQSKI